MESGAVVSESEQQRQRGNELYRAGKPLESLKHYESATEHAPKDYAPLANLAAAYFEIGDYGNSIRTAKLALALLDGDSEHQAPRQRLALRLVRAYVLTQNLDAADQALEGVAASPEKTHLEQILNATTKGKRGDDVIQTRRRTILMEPRYKPLSGKSSKDLGANHDQPTSLFDSSLFDTGRDQVSFFLANDLHARDTLSTLIHIADPAVRRPSQMRFHFTLVDPEPRMIARSLVIFLIVDDLAQRPNLDDPESAELSLLFYFYLAPLIPGSVYQHLQRVFARAVELLNGTNALSDAIKVPEFHRGEIIHVLQDWQQQGTSSGLTTQHIRNHIIQEGASPDEEAATQFYPETCRREAAFYRRTGTVLLGQANDSSSTKEQDAIFSSYKEGADVDGAILKSVDQEWEPNVTLVREQPEKTASDKTSPLNLSIHPFHFGSQLPSKGVGSDPRLFDFVKSWFVQVARAYKALSGHLTIELVAGDIAGVLDEIRFGVSDDAKSTIDQPRHDGSAEASQMYDRIHLSDIPDYIGGTLPVYLHAGPLLNTNKEAYVTWTCLRDSDSFRSWAHYDIEFIALQDPVDIEKTLLLRADAKTYPEDAMETFLSSRSVSGYRRARRTISAPQTFDKLLGRSTLETWLYRLFLKISIPFPQRTDETEHFSAPLNLTVFYRILEHLHQIGYPAHWLSDVVASILSGKISTAARPPRSSPLPPKAVRDPATALEQSTAPFVAEMRALSAVWQCLLGLGIQSDQVPALDTLRRYEIVFKDHSETADEQATLILVFIDRTLEPAEVEDLRPYLLSDEKGAQDEQAKVIREKGVHVLTTWEWDGVDKASFWLGKDVVEDMKQGDWVVSGVNTDTWRCFAKPQPVELLRETDERWP